MDKELIKLEKNFLNAFNDENKRFDAMDELIKCFSKKCQDSNKAMLKRQSTSKYSIYDVERMAEKYSRQLKKTVTYGQVSLFLDTGIKTF